MNEREDVEWTETEAWRIRDLARDAAPPAALEARVWRRLRDDSLLRAPRRFAPLLAATLAGVVCFGGGWALAHRVAAPAEADYVLLLRTAPADRDGNAAVAEYVAWARAARERGDLVGGEKLVQSGVLLEGDGARPIERGDVGGFFLIRANGLDEAVRIARDAPHLGHGGAIELRPIDRPR